MFVSGWNNEVIRIPRRLLSGIAADTTAGHCRCRISLPGAQPGTRTTMAVTDDGAADREGDDAGGAHGCCGDFPGCR